MEQREGKPLPRPERAWWGSSAKGKRIWAEAVPTGLGERNVTHLRDLFAILQVPHRRGLGGDAVQPPPASGECSFPSTLPPIPRLPLRGHEVRNASPAGARRREGGTDRDPPPAHSTVPSPGQASSGMTPTCQQARSRPPPAPPAGSLPPSRGRRPPPSLRSKRLCRARSLPQGFVPTAESRA